MAKIYHGNAGHTSSPPGQLDLPASSLELEDPAMSAIPCIHNCDLLVAGGREAGVAAALAAAASGAQVAVLAERTYLGDDGPGLLRCGSHANPRLAKTALEASLLAAGIPFLFATSPTHVLRDGKGKLAGAVFATAGGLVAVQAKILLDATAWGSLALVAGLARRPAGRRRLALTVLGKRPEDPGLACERIGELQWKEKDLDLWRCCVEADLGDGHPARWTALEASLRDRCYTSGQKRTADLLEDLDPPVATWLDDRCARCTGSGPELGAEAARRATRLAPGSSDLMADCASAVACPELRWLPGAARFANAPQIDLVGLDRLPDLGRCEVAVLGGGTAGAAAGIAAARAGAGTVVVEPAPGLGGVGTQGLIALYYHGNRCGFTNEVDGGVRTLGGCEGVSANGWTVEGKSAWWLRELRRAGGEAWLGCRGTGALEGGGRAAGLALATPWGPGILRSDLVVDASGAAEVPASLGAPTMTMGGDHLAVQGSGLGARDPDRQYANSDWTFIADDDPADQTRAYVSARTKHNGAFDVSQVLDTRERRRIVSEQDISPLDILAGRTWPDTIVTARSNFDSHGFTIHPLFLVVPPDRKSLDAHVPLRALLPKGLEGVLVTGLGMGAERDALPVLRMQPDVQNQGFAAGLAAAQALRCNGGRLRGLDIRSLQRQLAILGILDPSVLSHTDSFPLPEQELETAVASDLSGHRAVALLLADPQRSRPRLRTALAAECDPARRERLALALGALGDPGAASILADLIANRDWDEGWRFRGMGQFDRSLSQVDSLLVALGRAAGAVRAEGGQIDQATAALVAKAAGLDGTSPLSHCRALAVAAEALGDPALTDPLSRLLAAPGMGGWNRSSMATLRDEVDHDGCEVRERERTLRELYLARALWRLGDQDGRARRVLMAYAEDLRGHYARHSRCVLAEPAGLARTWDLARKLRAA